MFEKVKNGGGKAENCYVTACGFDFEPAINA